MLIFISEDTSKYHRALVLADSHSIYLADIRCLTAVFSTYQHTEIYSTNETIKFLTVDMMERKVIFAIGTEIYSLAVDSASPTAQHIVTSQHSVTGELYCFYCYIAVRLFDALKTELLLKV